MSLCGFILLEGIEEPSNSDTKMLLTGILTYIYVYKYFQY